MTIKDLAVGDTVNAGEKKKVLDMLQAKLWINQLLSIRNQEVQKEVQ